jgi:hypothetical protein
VRRLHVAARALVVASVIAGCGVEQGAGTNAQPSEESLTLDVPVAVATSAVQATMRICHASHGLDRNALIEFDANTVWELAVNLEPELAAVEDDAVRRAGRAVADELPPMFEAGGPTDSELSRVEDLLVELYAACDEWTYDRLYGTG